MYKVLIKIYFPQKMCGYHKYHDKNIFKHYLFLIRNLFKQTKKRSNQVVLHRLKLWDRRGLDHCNKTTM